MIQKTLNNIFIKQNKYLVLNNSIHNSIIDSKYSNDFHINYDVITKQQEQDFISYLNPLFYKRKYEGNHWDSVITNYKEISINNINNDEITSILNECYNDIKAFMQRELIYLPIHAIDLSPVGYIAPHVDSIKFSGELVAVLSLLSTRILRLTRHYEETNKDTAIESYDLIIPPRSLYIITGQLRYDFTHEILNQEDSKAYIEKSMIESFDINRRISIMFRDIHPSDYELYHRNKK